MCSDCTGDEKIFQQVENLLNIGIALSAERDRNRLLEMIVTEARRITNADAGTLYLRENDHLIFKIIQNRTMGLFQGGSGEMVDLPPVPLNTENVSGYAAASGQSINVPDVYNAQRFDFSGPKNYDRITGYRTVSMLVVPLVNHEQEVIGVLQLINSMDENNQTIRPFARHYQKVVESLASQAAIALTNAKLMSDIENLFNSFVEVITAAIDARTPYNANHTRRVALLAGVTAEVINNCRVGRWKDEFFSRERLEQLVMSGWMHDIGKIATPLSVMNKATRLENRINPLMQRLDAIYHAKRAEYLALLLELHKQGDFAGEDLHAGHLEEQLKEIIEAKNLIEKANHPGTFIDEEISEKLYLLSTKTYVNMEGVERPYLTRDELECLTIRRGTLTEEERLIMEDHVAITARMLEKIPFIKKFKDVPLFSSMHHEYLDGKGYPNRMKGDEIPLEARILALVDIYDALTAGDRPYKKALPVEEALKIIGFMIRDGKLDGELFELFKENKVWERIE